MFPPEMSKHSWPFLMIRLPTKRQCWCGWFLNGIIWTCSLVSKAKINSNTGRQFLYNLQLVTCSVTTCYLRVHWLTWNFDSLFNTVLRILPSVSVISYLSIIVYHCGYCIIISNSENVAKNAHIDFRCKSVALCRILLYNLVFLCIVITCFSPGFTKCVKFFANSLMEMEYVFY